jgi:uncharacterized membrane protein
MINRLAGLKKMFACALLLAVGGVFVLTAFVQPARAANATLFLSPASGTFQVESTFDVSIFLNTQGNSINTVDVALRFPPDKLQLVSSGTGRSIIGLWTSLPKYNNQTGIVELTGGIPGGVNVERGLITTLTFRVKAVGQAVVKFDRTKILLNDGQGTEALTQNQNSIYDFILPPPSGPVVVSETHPDQTRWYKNNTVILRWDNESGASGFSYIISDQPIDVPDEISEGEQRTVTYRNLADGRRYFHIRALRSGSWGGSTHYAINIDASAPAEFNVDILPSARTTHQQPIIQFGTTDTLSGTDHFELKIVDIKNPAANTGSEQIFIEVQSPYIPSELPYGEYDVIVRAYDKAGNYREITKRLEIVPVASRYFSSKGLEITNFMFPWWLVILILLLLIIMLYFLGRRIHLWHRHIDRRRNAGQLPSDVRFQMDELQRYRQKYGKISGIILMSGLLIFGSGSVQAQDTSTRQDVFEAPIITTLSRNITNDEIFYIGGKAGSANAQVVLYIQNSQTAETISETMNSDKNGDWFYRHDTFLTAGNYVMWAQSKRDGELSPPSPQVNVMVEETAIQFGATRISYATLYMLLFFVALLILIILIVYILYHFIHGRRKHASMLKEISEAQESLRRGFAVLNRDIQAELEILKRAKLNQKLSIEEKEKEEQLLKDLQEIEQYMSKEIWDIERAEQIK